MLLLYLMVFTVLSRYWTQVLGVLGEGVVPAPGAGKRIRMHIMQENERKTGDVDSTPTPFSLQRSVIVA
ncbi:hypothetical protein chiPu_0007651 [Chiloscyllium punctatum]|uniref:Secreted protein n=1 Tax=Chiloscyllium punctatum TaxID=137246 RepID=A0A401SFS4_CHIPU|nr:hypothetical protein [Chiloscyllium punctatum]